MITGRAASCLRLATSARKHHNVRQLVRCQRSSSTTAAPITTAPHSSLSALSSLTSELDKLSPRYDVPADSIQIIKSPREFYETLKAKISNARFRIYLSTLYVGKSEYELVDTIRDALKRNPGLKVSLLTDALRGTREAPDPSCASLLASLIVDFGPDRVEVRLFHTPNLVGFRKAILPKRINEGWGLQHMKLYGVDDEIIMSGANLSNDYFTNRQDRYHVLSSKEVTDYFFRVYQAVCSLSYRVVPDDKAPGGFIQEWPSTNVQPAPLAESKAFIASGSALLAPLCKPHPSLPLPANSTSDTSIYPLLQLTPLLNPDTSTELPALTAMLHALSSPALAGSKWTFTAGYFNMTPEVRALLLHSNPSSATVVAASPWANGFYGSRGISGMLPAAYTLLGRRFLDAVARAGLSQRIALKEWRRGTVDEADGWTYHAKGIWVTLPGEQSPAISLVGSSNYTKRSYSLDLEANALIVTRNEALMRRLGEEEEWLQEFAAPMTSDEYARTERRVGLHVQIAMWIVTLVGGAL